MLRVKNSLCDFCAFCGYSPLTTQTLVRIIDTRTWNIHSFCESCALCGYLTENSQLKTQNSNMCIQTALQSKIAELTDNGDTIVRFLADTAHGAIPGAKLHHRVDAAKTLAKYGALQQVSVAQLPSSLMGEGQDGVKIPLVLSRSSVPPCETSSPTPSRATSASAPAAARPSLRRSVTSCEAARIHASTANSTTRLW